MHELSRKKNNTSTRTILERITEEDAHFESFCIKAEVIRNDVIFLLFYFKKYDN